MVLTMKMQEIIKLKRKELNLTQEQVAQYLGVTAPAVNKWEKGICYPDITLLPIIARLLKIDLNTLMCFEEDLSEFEINKLSQNILDEQENNTLDEIYSFILNKIKLFPTNDLLKSSLLGTFFIVRCLKGENSLYQKEIITMYKELTLSSNIDIQNNALDILISIAIEESNFEEATNFIEQLTDEEIKKESMLNIYKKTSKFKEANTYLQENLIVNITNVITILTDLVEVAELEKNTKKMKYLVDLIEQSVDLFDLWDILKYANSLKLYAITKNKQDYTNTLEKFKISIEKSWDIDESNLYTEIENDTIASNFEIIKNLLLKNLEDNAQIDF